MGSLAVGLVAMDRFNNIAFWLVALLLVAGFGTMTYSLILIRKKERMDYLHFREIYNELKGFRDDFKEWQGGREDKED